MLLAIAKLALTRLASTTVSAPGESIVTGPTIVEVEIVLLVNVCASVVPTIVPLGAVTVLNTPLVNLAIPLPVARLSNLPVVPENTATSLSTDVAVLVDASPLPVLST